MSEWSPSGPFDHDLVEFFKSTVWAIRIVFVDNF
jgi:hypothetical protein